MAADTETLDTVREVTGSGYKYGFETVLEMDLAPKGLSADIIRLISARKQEPEWMLQWRLAAYESWLKMREPEWALVDHAPIDYQDLHYYAAPKQRTGPASLDEVDPELLRTYEKLGIPLKERAILAGVDRRRKQPIGGSGNVAVDAVFDSVSVATTFRETLSKSGVIFCPISEAVREHPESGEEVSSAAWCRWRTIIFAALNSAVFTDGSFVFVPKGVRCPMELSTYFRINARNTGQFERTLIICEDNAQVSYLEGCTAPMRDENQLHAAVVELVALEDAQHQIFSTVQNWYPGDENGRRRHLQFRDQARRTAAARGRAKFPGPRWRPVRRSPGNIRPACWKATFSVGEFYSVAVTNNCQQADTGTKMIHIGRNTRSTIVSKGISAGRSSNTYRGLVRILPRAEGRAEPHAVRQPADWSRNAPRIPCRISKAAIRLAKVEHEATTSKIAEDQLFYCRSRGLSQEDAVGLIVNGFCKEVLKELPMEFAVEAQKLLAVSLEGSVG